MGEGGGSVWIGEWTTFVVFALILGGFVAVGERLYAGRRLSPRATRRWVHAGVGLTVAAIPLFFAAPIWPYVLAFVFTAGNAIARTRGWFRGMHAAASKSWGTVAFPLALLLALWICWTLDPSRRYWLSVAFVVLGVADPMASWIGLRQGGDRPYRFGRPPKSWAGSMAFAATTLVLCLAGFSVLVAIDWLDWSPAEILLAALSVTGAATATEALAGSGWDNLFIVLAVLAVGIPFAERPDERLWIAGALLFGTAFGAMAYSARALTAAGAVAGGLFGASILALGGWVWMVPALAFFVLSSLLSRVGVRRKAAARRQEAKGSVRDAGQVYANGGIAWLCLLGYSVWPSAWWYAGFVGAFAAAAADTWATEIGTLTGRPPRSIVTFRRVPSGTSGGVSIAGTIGAMGGALVVIGSAVLAGAPWTLQQVVVVFAGALVASFVDSLLGATVQVRYRDPRTGALTERRGPDDRPFRAVQGWRWLTNDRVNLAGSAVGALWAIGYFRFVEPALYIPAGFG